MKASVVIPTLNRPNAIIDTITALQNQNIASDQFQVIIVDDGSEKAAVQKLRSHCDKIVGLDICVLFQPTNSGKAKAVNRGLGHVKYDLTLLTDDDCIPAQDWISGHMDAHKASKTTCSVIGPICLPIEWINSSNFARYINSRYIGNRINDMCGEPLKQVTPNYFGGGNVSIPTNILRNIGMFNEEIGRSQDVELGYRLWGAGVPICYSARPKIVHYSEASLDIDRWIPVLTKSYLYSIPKFKKLHAEAVEKYSHWFLERPDFNKDSISRIATKLSLRFLISKKISYVLNGVLKKKDLDKRYYLPIAFKYVIASACLESVKEREKNTFN